MYTGGLIFAFVSEIVPLSSPWKDTVPDFPEWTSSRKSVKVNGLFVKVSGALGGAVLNTLRLVATTSVSPDVACRVSSVRVMVPVPGASAWMTDGLRDQLYFQGMNSA